MTKENTPISPHQEKWSFWDLQRSREYKSWLFFFGYDIQHVGFKFLDQGLELGHNSECDKSQPLDQQGTPWKLVFIRKILVLQLWNNFTSLLSNFKHRNSKLLLEEQKILIQRGPAKMSLLQFSLLTSWKRPSKSTAIHLFIKYFEAVNAFLSQIWKIFIFQWLNLWHFGRSRIIIFWHWD